jgi:hypothetical protein
MARVELHFRDGHKEVEQNCGTSVYNGKLYIWERGQRKNRMPRRVIDLNLLHTRKATGQKGIFIYKY